MKTIATALAALFAFASIANAGNVHLAGGGALTLTDGSCLMTATGTLDEYCL